MLMQKIDEDLKAAMKEKNQIKLETLRMLKAALLNFLIEKKKSSVEDSEIFSLIQKQIKLRIDAIEGFKKANRAQSVEKETLEKAFLEAYLPPTLSDEELKNLIQTVVQKTGAKSKADLGKVMKEVVSEVKGRADGKRISELALALLST